MSIVRVGLFAVVISLIVFGVSRPVCAQGSLGAPEWLEVSSLLSSSEISAIYFFNPTWGLAVESNFGFPSIRYIAPGAQSWRMATTPSGFSQIRVLRFIQNKLYAATDGGDALVSVDSGKTWKFSGLGLQDAYDIYADASGVIRALRYPMKTFARLDTLHCIATGPGTIFNSLDGGLTWRGFKTGSDTFSYGAFADRCRNVYICPNSWGTAFRSTDFGETWRTVITGSGPGPEYLYGASVTSYITDSAGLFRSTDDGLTWKSIITVDGGPHALFPFGPMGEHVAASCGADSHISGSYVAHVMDIFLTSTGGDDMLHSGTNMTDSNGAPLMQQDTFNVPLRLLSTCNSMRIPVPFLSDVDSMIEDVSIANDSTGDFSLPGRTHTVLRRGREDTVWLNYQPHHSVSHLTVRIENHWNCSDWSETRSVIVDALPAAGIMPPPTLAGNCKPVRGAALVQIDSCQTLVIDSVVIPSWLRSRLSFDSPLPDTIKMGTNDSLFFRFNPRDTLATISDSVEVYGHYPGMDSAMLYWDYGHVAGFPLAFGSFHTTIPVKLSALGSTKQIDLKDGLGTHNLGTIYACESRDTTLWLVNHGCTTTTVDSVRFSNGAFSSTVTSAPFLLPTDSLVPLRVHLTPDRLGDPQTISGTMTIYSNADSERIVSVPFQAKVLYPTPIAFSMTSIASAAAGATVPVTLVLQGDRSSLTSVSFALTNDDDLLAYQTLSGAGLHLDSTHIGSDGHTATRYFTLSPIPQSDTIGTLIFSVYLARGASTSLQLSERDFKNAVGLPNDCVASFTSSTSSFNYVNGCADSLIREYMLTGTALIQSLRPNPARNVLTVSLAATTPSSYLVTDLLGKEMLRGVASGTFTLDITRLGPGTYFLRVANQHGAQSRRFVVVR